MPTTIPNSCGHDTGGGLCTKTVGRMTTELLHGLRVAQGCVSFEFGFCIPLFWGFDSGLNNKNTLESVYSLFFGGGGFEVSWGGGTSKDGDEVNRRDVCECDG